MLKVKNLTAIHSSGKELIDVTLKVDKGEIFAVVGTNDSGKSLLGKIIADQTIDHQGSIVINHLNRSHEKDMSKYHIGYSPAEPVLDDYLTGYEYLDFIGSILGIDREERSKQITVLANEYGLKGDIYRLVELLSPAQKKKISLISSIIHNPTVVVWDEPTSHLDPIDQDIIKAQLKHLKDQKTSVLLISNDTLLLEEVSDYFIVMKNGTVQMQGTLSQLKNQTGSKTKSLKEILTKTSRDE